MTPQQVERGRRRLAEAADADAASSGRREAISRDSTSMRAGRSSVRVGVVAECGRRARPAPRGASRCARGRPSWPARRRRSTAVRISRRIAPSPVSSSPPASIESRTSTRSATSSSKPAVVAAGLVRGVVDQPVAGALQPDPHEAELEPVGLVGVEPPDRLPRDRAAPRRRPRGSRAARRWPSTMRVEAVISVSTSSTMVDQLGEAGGVLQVQDLQGHRGRDVGVAVAVTAGPGAEAQRARGRRQRDVEPGQLAVELLEQVGHDLGGDRAQVVDRRAGLVGRLGPHDPQLVGLPQQVDELGEASLVGPPLRRPDGAGPPSRATVSATLRSSRSTRAAAGLGGVGGEDGAVLEPPQHRGEQLAGRGCRRPAPSAIRSDGRRRADPASSAVDLLPAVQLLGGVDELEVGREGAGQHAPPCRASIASSTSLQLGVVGLAGQAADPSRRARAARHPRGG